MANEQNLRPSEYKLSREEAKKGGIASGESRRKKRDLKIAMEALLEKEYANSNGTSITGAEAIAMKQMERALQGDSKAFELVRDTAGQKPIEKVMLAEVDQEIIDEVERMVLADD